MIGAPAIDRVPVASIGSALSRACHITVRYAYLGGMYALARKSHAQVCVLVSSGAGWSIVDPLSARTFEHLGLAIRAFEPAIYYEIGALCAHESEPSILAQSFLAMLSDKLDAVDG
jgi:DNA-binding transcriptional LysR family regulator